MPLARLIQGHLDQRTRVELPSDRSTPCGVLLPLLATETGYELLYTLRTDSLPSHGGQVSFPGGKQAPRDRGPEDTALREASEELGIDADDVRVIGRLDDVYTLGVEYLITPVVGVLDQRATLSPNPGEVADVFTVDVEELGDPAHRGSVKKSWGGTQYDMPVITAGRHNIWGATYSITLNFLDCVRSARGD
ncbi:MAG: CoA pyrophosphatase [Deltaproteobacteria bacterium]|jgi:8-oxo-dGTP pyrophosphatase MutT (NUDIX family)|nr:CoA pyrophosphatase [Deltaproteobacteria bacterium]